MSKSITELLKTIALNTDDVKRKDDEIYNSEGLHNEQVLELDESIEITDQYNNVMKNEGLYNGAYLPLKENGLHQLMGQRKFDFTLTSAIDPNFKRSKIDPDSAMPSYNKYSKFSLMPEAVEAPTNQISLVKQSKSSYLNYRNRLEPQAQQQQQQVAPSLAPKNGKIEEGYQFYADMDDDAGSPPPYDFDDGMGKEKETTIHKDPAGETIHTTDHNEDTHKDPVEEPEPEIPIYGEDPPDFIPPKSKIPIYGEDPVGYKPPESKIPIYGEDPVGYKPPKSKIPIFGEDPPGYMPKFRKDYTKQVVGSRSSNLLLNTVSNPTKKFYQ